MGLKVECYEGYQAEETPRRLELDGQVIELAVDARWRTPEARWFRVCGADGETFVLKRDEASGEWSLGQAVGSSGRANPFPAG